MREDDVVDRFDEILRAARISLHKPEAMIKNKSHPFHLASL